MLLLVLGALSSNAVNCSVHTVSFSCLELFLKDRCGFRIDKLLYKKTSLLLLHSKQSARVLIFSFEHLIFNQKLMLVIFFLIRRSIGVPGSVGRA